MCEGSKADLYVQWCESSVTYTINRPTQIKQANYEVIVVSAEIVFDLKK